MLYCTRCGTRLVGNENFCTCCGENLKKNNTYNNIDLENKDRDKNASVVLGIISIVGCFLIFTAPVSLILAIVGLVLAIKSNKKVSNVLGIVLNSVGLFISLVACLFFLLVIHFIIDDLNNDVYTDQYEEYYEDYLDDYDHKYDF